MKHLLYTVLFLFASISGFTQVMQASIGTGSSPTRVMIYIKPTLAVNGNISTLQFDVALPSAVTPEPIMSIVGTPAIGTGWIVTPTYIEDGYRHYEILTAAVFNVNIGAGVETPVMELQFSGGVSSSSVSLVTLPQGGANTGNALFLCTGAATSVEGQLYYPRPGTSVINNLSYTGGLASSATVGGILLPIKWLSFDVIKQGNNALLSWSVANELTNHHYELERSSNGINYTNIGIVNKSANGNTTYNYTDVEINNLNATILYYRIKQVDTDGKSSYSDTRFITIDKKSIPFENRDNSIVKLNLISANGQFIGSREITTQQASNYYFNIKDRAIAAGEYYLQIIFKGELIGTKKLLVNK
jgi:hypothetical protein